MVLINQVLSLAGQTLEQHLVSISKSSLINVVMLTLQSDWSRIPTCTVSTLTRLYGIFSSHCIFSL